MRAKLKGLFVIIGVLFGGFLIAQQKTISGTVTDENGFPIYDAVITAPSGQETYSDLDGNFSISVNAGDVITIEAMDKNLALIKEKKKDYYFKNREKLRLYTKEYKRAKRKSQVDARRCEKTGSFAESLKSKKGRKNSRSQARKGHALKKSFDAQEG